MATVATLVARLDGDTAGINRAIRQTESLAEGLGQTLRRVGENALSFGAGIAGLNALQRGFEGLKTSVFGMNSTLETSELQFETLMGNADLARAHVAMLFDIAKKTPFETGPILQASRMLETFGGAALNTRDNILLVGDSAAVANAPIQDLAFWIGRAYSMIQGGQPFGEAAMRLQELTVLTPHARAQMEALQKAGASSAEVWRVLQGELGRFNGAMEKQAGTWQGVVSTFEDTKNILLSKVFKPIFEAARNSLARLNEFLGADEMEAWASRTSAYVGSVVKGLSGVGSALWDLAGIFVSSMSNMLQTVVTIGQAIYKAFSYINPFARHSPSLVESVELGVDTILAKFATLSGVEGTLRHANAAMEQFISTGMAAFKQFDASEMAKAEKALTTFGGSGLAASFRVAQASIRELKDEMSALRQEIEDTESALSPLKAELEEVNRAAKAQQLVVKEAELGLIPYKQQMFELANVARPWIDAEQHAKTVLEDAQATLSIATNAQHKYADEVARTEQELQKAQLVLVPFKLEESRLSIALSEAKDALESQRDALGGMKDAFDSASLKVNTLRDSLSEAREELRRFTEAPTIGSQKFREDLAQLDRQILQVQLSLSRVSVGALSSSASSEGLRKQLASLQAQRESLRLQKQINDLPATRAADEAQFAGLTEITVGDKAAGIAAAAGHVGALVTALTPAEKLLHQAKAAYEGALAPINQLAIGLHGLEREHNAATRALHAQTNLMQPYVDAHDRAKAAQAGALSTLQPLVREVDAAKVALFEATANARPWHDAIRDLSRETQAYVTDAIEPARHAYELLALEQSVIQGQYDIEKDKLTELKEAYDAVKDRVNNWEQALKGVASAAEAVAKTHVAAPLPTVLRPAVSPPEDLIAANVQLQEDLGKIAKTLKDVETAIRSIDPFWVKLAAGVALAVVSIQIGAVTIGALGVALELILSPIGLLIVAIAGLGIAWQTNFANTQVVFEMLHIAADKLFKGDIPGALDVFGRTLGFFGHSLATELGKWADQFIAWIEPLIPPFLDELGKLKDQFFSWITDRAKDLAKKLRDEWIPATVDWIEAALPKLGDELPKFLTKVIRFVGDNGPAIAEKMAEWGVILAGEMWAGRGWVAHTAMTKILPALGQFLVKVSAWLVDEAPIEIRKASVNLGLAIVDGMAAGLANLLMRLKETIEKTLRDLQVDFGVFHLKAGAFTMDMPAPLGAPSLAGAGGPNITVQPPPVPTSPSGSQGSVRSPIEVNTSVNVGVSVGNNRELADLVAHENTDALVEAMQAGW